MSSGWNYTSPPLNFFVFFYQTGMSFHPTPTCSATSETHNLLIKTKSLWLPPHTTRSVSEDKIITITIIIHRHHRTTLVSALCSTLNTHRPRPVAPSAVSSTTGKMQVIRSFITRQRSFFNAEFLSFSSFFFLCSFSLDASYLARIPGTESCESCSTSAFCLLISCRLLYSLVAASEMS